MKSAITSDRDGLLALVRDKTEAGRRRLTGVIDDLFFAHRDVLSDRERALMAEILRQLVHAIELPVRRGLAERLAELPDAPHDMMLSLADDELEIVYARLIKGDVLHDRDLVELVHHRALEHQLAATIRMSRVETSSETPAAGDDGAGPDVIKALIDDRRGAAVPCPGELLARVGPARRLSRAGDQRTERHAGRHDGTQGRRVGRDALGRTGHYCPFPVEMPARCRDRAVRVAVRHSDRDPASTAIPPAV